MTKEQDVNVILTNFPAPGNEMVVPNEDGTFTILINAKLSYDGQLKAYQHAINHICNNDFNKEDVQKIEYQAHDFPIPNNAQSMSAKRFEQRLKTLRREHRKLKREMEKKEQEINLVMEMYGTDCFFSAAEYNYLYGGME